MIRIKLDEMLREKGMTKYKLLKRADTTYPVINKIIDGKAVHINLSILERICRALECAPGDLLELVGDPKDGADDA